MSLTIEDIAKQVYYTNKAWCEANGDFSFTTSWEESPIWQRQTNIKGVEFLIQNPDASPSASHDSWMKEKTEQGWVWGEKKDSIAKTHPAYLPYDQLPNHQKVKDYLFRGVVRAMYPFLDVDEINEVIRNKRETVVVTDKDVGNLNDLVVGSDELLTAGTVE